MAFGTPAPFVKAQFTDDNGNPLAGGKLYTYAAGTTTPATTYTDVNLTTPNANPIILDSAGRATIYLPLASFKFLMKNSADATQWTQDNVPSVGYTQTIVTADNAVCEGRLSLTNGTAVTTPDVTAATSIFWNPYKGNRIALYDTASGTWIVYTFSTLTFATAGLAVSTNYDLFAKLSGGVVALDKVVWGTNTTRTLGGALALQDGVYVLGGDLSWRYLGTFRTTAAVGIQTEDSLANRFVWNYYNRVKRPMSVFEATASWTYTTATWRQANGATTNALNYVVGIEEDPIVAVVGAQAANTNANVSLGAAMGVDVTNTPDVQATPATFASQVANVVVSHTSSMRKFCGLGYHAINWLEFSAATGTTTWTGSAPHAGIIGELLG